MTEDRDTRLVLAAIRLNDFRIKEEHGKIFFGLGDLDLIYNAGRNKAEVIEDMTYCSTVYLTALKNRLKQVVTDFYKTQKETFN